jgi:protein KRI1
MKMTIIVENIPLESTRSMPIGSSTIKRGKSFIDVSGHNLSPWCSVTKFLAVEEKLGRTSAAAKNTLRSDSEAQDDDSSSSTSEEEDDEGILVTEALDAEIAATLAAIKSNDPRVHDKNVTFYSKFDDEGDTKPHEGQKHKPMYLQDYHRLNLLRKDGMKDEDEDNAPAPLKTYAEEQSELKRTVITEMHTAADQLDGDDSDDDFFAAKPNADIVVQNTKRSKSFAEQEDVLALADQEPDAFLSNYMASRAWIPTANARMEPFESDDDEEDQRADEFEQAYNLRFEDPAVSNEKLITHARDAVAKYSVRRPEPSGRKKARELERQQKEMVKREREQEKARLRKLKIEENEKKLRMIREAAGLRGDAVRQEDWVAFLEEAWDLDDWEREMKQRFGDAYYEEREDDDPHGGKRKKPRKPKWDDDININDLVPDFEAEGSRKPMTAMLSESEPEDGAAEVRENWRDGEKKTKRVTGQRSERKSIAPQDRRLISEFVDEKLDLTSHPVLASSSKTMAPFRYRETSPLSYGLTAQDILMASDSQLNKYAGLKKLATFRDPQKKRKDKRRLGKKARLREWRRETFGGDDVPTFKLDIESTPPQSKSTGSDSRDSRHQGGAGEGKRKAKRRKTGEA